MPHLFQKLEDQDSAFLARRTTPNLTAKQEQEYHVRDLMVAHFSTDPNILDLRFSCPIRHSSAHVDGMILSACTDGIARYYWIEAKERTYWSKSQPDWVLDRFKVNALREYTRKTGIEAMYLSIHPDGIAYLWPIEAHRKEERTVNCKGSTYDRTPKRDKAMYAYLPSDGITFKLPRNIA